jgi:hypothetical protein
MPSELKTSPSLIFPERHRLRIRRFLSRPSITAKRKRMQKRILSIYGKINNNSLSKYLNLYITNIFLKKPKQPIQKVR